MRDIKEQKNETYIIVEIGDQIIDNKLSVLIYDFTLEMWANVKELPRVVVLTETTMTKRMDGARHVFFGPLFVHFK